jgi:hypothetical protein
LKCSASATLPYWKTVIKIEKSLVHGWALSLL